jgi:ABC-type transport system substrate-binding protein
MSEQEYRMKPVGTGPFKFLEHVPNDRLVLVRNERYFRARIEGGANASNPNSNLPPQRGKGDRK